MLAKQAGFTLIELLVVLVIISIIITFALNRFGDFGEERAIVSEADYLVHYIDLVKEEALLEATTLGIRIDQTGYEVLRFKAPNQWQPMQSSLFHHHAFQKNLQVKLVSKKHRMLVINPTGTITPFELTIGAHNAPPTVTITGRYDGTLTVKKP